MKGFTAPLPLSFFSSSYPTMRGINKGGIASGKPESITSKR